jgi:hypothetical protein
MRKMLLATVMVGMACVQAHADRLRVEPDYNAKSYINGSNDRDAWESWFSSLYGGQLAGAQYWADKRNKSDVLPCGVIAQGDNDFLAGCLNAMQRLSSIDWNRDHDPQYWNGWNKKTGYTPGIPGQSAPTPTYTPPVEPQVGGSVEHDTAICVRRVHSMTGNFTFNAYYVPETEHYQMFGQKQDFFYFQKCMHDFGHVLTD